MPDDQIAHGADWPSLIAMNQDQYQRAVPGHDAGATSFRVGYVMTHYPRLAQTFITGEIDAVERAGVDIHCFAMNAPDAVELEAPGARERAARTIYLKAAPAKAVGALLAMLVRHPFGACRILAKAIASGGGNVARTMRRLAHAAQAALVANEVRELNIAHLHAHFGLAPATIAWLASGFASLGGRPVGFSFTIHGFHDFVDPAEARLDLKARDAKGVVCISDFTRSQLFLLTEPALWPRFHVVRCGIDLSEFTYRAPSSAEPPLTLLAVGRLSREKGFALLIEAVAQLRAEGVPFHLRLVGDGPLRSDLDAASLNIRECVTLTGERPPSAVREELGRADIFCLPSFSEGLPVSIMEAMAAGVPVVTTWVAGIPELAQNGLTALTVPPARADALADALRTLSGDPALRQRLAAEARHRVERLHDQRVNGQQMATLLRSFAL